MSLLLRELTPEERIAITEIRIDGPWSFSDNFELLDTPGWGHDKTQDYNNINILQRANVVLCVGSRIAGNEEIKKLIQDNIFSDENTVFGTLHLGADEIKLTNNNNNNSEAIIEKKLEELKEDIHRMLRPLRGILPAALRRQRS